MKIQGIIKNVEVDGYERVLTLQTSDRTLWCSHVQPNEYLEPGQVSKYLQVNLQICFYITLNLVGKYEVLEHNIECGITQDILGSPHAIVIGKVMEKLSADAYSFAIGGGIQLDVEFEKNLELNIGDLIRVKGELAAEDEFEK